MNDKIVKKLTRMVSRRGILASLSAGAAALASSLLGNARAAAATYTVFCCHLCQPSSTSCFDTTCACSWSWICGWFDGVRCRTYRCLECHNSNTVCGPACSNIKCSRAILEAGC